jgi:hypothetical protein
LVIAATICDRIYGIESKQHSPLTTLSKRLVQTTLHVPNHTPKNTAPPSRHNTNANPSRRACTTSLNHSSPFPSLLPATETQQDKATTTPIFDGNHLTSPDERSDLMHLLIPLLPIQFTLPRDQPIALPLSNLSEVLIVTRHVHALPPRRTVPTVQPVRHARLAHGVDDCRWVCPFVAPGCEGPMSEWNLCLPCRESFDQLFLLWQECASAWHDTICHSNLHLHRYSISRIFEVRRALWSGRVLVCIHTEHATVASLAPTRATACHTSIQTVHWNALGSPLRSVIKTIDIISCHVPCHPTRMHASSVSS